MRNEIVFLPFFLFAFLFGSAQDGTKELRGRVSSPDRDVVGVVIQNLGTDRAVITDLEGQFSIGVRLGDTLVFSAVHFRKKFLPVTPSLYNSSFVEVPLEEFVNELDEVVVRPYNLSGDLSTDLPGLGLAPDVSAEALGLPNAHRKIPTQSQRMLQEAGSLKGLGLGLLTSVPLNPLINAITGRTKMLKQRVALEADQARTQRVQGSYEESLFVSALKIPVEKIDDFMYFCEADQRFPALADGRDPLKLWGFMLEKSRAYRANNNLD